MVEFETRVDKFKSYREEIYRENKEKGQKSLQNPSEKGENSDVSSIKDITTLDFDKRKNGLSKHQKMLIIKIVITVIAVIAVLIGLWQLGLKVFGG